MNHYDFLNKHLRKFFLDVGVDGGWEANCGIISAHGDKFYGYQNRWEKAGIHWYHGCMIMMLTYTSPFGKEVRQVGDKWVDPSHWVIENYSRFQKYLPEV